MGAWGHWGLIEIANNCGISPKAQLQFFINFCCDEPIFMVGSKLLLLKSGLV